MTINTLEFPKFASGIQYTSHDEERKELRLAEGAKTGSWDTAPEQPEEAFQGKSVDADDADEVQKKVQY